MDKNKKAAIAVGVVAAGTALALALRAKAAPPGEEPPVGEAFFIMEGEAPRDTLWPLGLEVYSMRGVVKNIGSEPGSTEVMGWFTVGDSSQVYNICSELVTLPPSGTKNITCEISRDMLEAALEDDMSIMPAMPTEGETVYIRCRATNHSAMGETLSRVVNLMIDGELVKSWDLTLDWADSVYLEHTVVAAGIGTHSVGFDGLQKSFEVVVSLPPNLLIPELTKIFDGKALYPQLSHPDADIAYKNRAMETADFTVQRHTLYIPSNNKAIWEFEGNWELGDDKLLYLGPSLRLIEEGAYETTPYTLPGGRWQDRYPNCGLQAVGYEDYINKFANCCLDLRYLPQADWWNWFGVVDWDMGFYQASTDPVSVANGQLWDERAEGHTSGNYKFYVESFFGWNWKGWHYPPVSMNWVVLLEINVAMMLTTGMKDIFPLYSWKVGTLSF